MKKELLNIKIKGGFIKKRGFTLIELLVVIAIIGILTALMMANFSAARSRSRDAKRISDIAQIQLALELLFDRCNSYPATGALTTSSGCGSYTLGTFISAVPTDSGSAYSYTMSSGDYVLKATLENASGLPANDLNGTILGVNCDGTYYCVQPR